MTQNQSNVMLLPGAIPNAREPLEAVMTERVRQVGMWGLQRQDFRTWLSILTEEVGEFAKEVNRHTFTMHAGEQTIAMNAMYDELAQVAAVSVQIMEQIDAIRAGAPVPQGPQIDEKTTGQGPVADYLTSVGFTFTPIVNKHDPKHQHDKPHFCTSYPDPCPWGAPQLNIADKGEGSMFRQEYRNIPMPETSEDATEKGAHPFWQGGPHRYPPQPGAPS